MEKIIVSKIKSNDSINEYKSNLIEQKNKLLYMEDDVKVILENLFKKIILTRKNKEFEAKFTFIKNKKTVLEYKLVKENLKLDIEIYTKCIKIVANEIKIVYILNDIEYEYTIFIKEEL